MGRSRVLSIAALMVAVAACGSGDSSTADVSPSPTTVGATDPVTSGPATVDATAPGSSILIDEEPSVQGLSLRFGSVTDRSVDIAADGRNTTTAVAGMNEFATDLYTAVASGETGNVVVSPYSVTFTLAMSRLERSRCRGEQPSGSGTSAIATAQECAPPSR